MFSYSIIAAALDSVAGAWTRHMLFDAQADGEGWIVALRGEDRSRAGSDSKIPPLKIWNDENGAARVFPLARVEGEGAEAEANRLAEGLRAFYGAEGKAFSGRVEAMDPTLTTLALMVATIGQSGARPHACRDSRWRVGSVKDTKEAKAAARESKNKVSAIATITAAAADPAKLAEIASAIAPEQLAAMEAILAARAKHVAAK